MFGLTTACTIAPPLNQFNCTLDQQVMFDGRIEQISRNLIESVVAIDGRDGDSSASDRDDDGSYPLADTEVDTDVDETYHTSSDSEESEDSNPTPLFTVTTPKECKDCLPDVLEKEIQLLSTMRTHKTPLSAYKEIWDWAHDEPYGPPSRSRKKIFADIKEIAMPHLQDDRFEPKLISWLPDDTPQTIYVRSFDNAIRSLLTNTDLCCERNLSFPNSDSPYEYQRLPALTDDTVISELHHGNWWINTWEKRCDPLRKEVLVPVIFYMDGIAVDTHGKLSLTPLSMTLGIFNTEARKRKDAWETLYFHPSSSEANAIDNVQNLHIGIEAALESFNHLCLSQRAIKWTNLPWAGKEWEVNLKFSIAFFIGDTEMHNKLCGRFANHTDKVKRLCRHCACPVNWTHLPSKNIRRPVFRPQQLDPTQVSDATFKLLSHHPIRNVFHGMDFGENPNNIHLASPGEKLHMHQLGTAKRAISSFVTRFQPSNKGAIRDTISALMSRYGAELSRQSEKDLPRVNFTSDYLSTVKKEGKDYAGLILCLILALLSTKGSEVMRAKEEEVPGTIENLVRTLESIIGMEEFLKHGAMKRSHAKNLPAIVADFLNGVHLNCYREKHMGQRLIKYHLYFHLQQYIEMWGTPAGWDSAPSESHHKSEIKAPSQATQRNKAKFIQQTSKRHLEYRLLDRVVSQFSMEKESASRPKQETGGSRFTIVLNGDSASMNWTRKKENAGKSCHPQDVIDCCREALLPKIGNNEQVPGFTEFNKSIGSKNEWERYRAHPSYRSNSGQRNSVWYDWAFCQFRTARGEAFTLPCQLLCFLDLRTFEAFGDLRVVVRVFTSQPTSVSQCSTVRQGRLRDKLYLVAASSIEKPALVVKDHGEANRYFVVGNRSVWLEKFVEKADSLGEASSLYHNEDHYPVQYPDPDVDELLDINSDSDSDIE
eukprot:CAMPEP_0116116834 /NCGR_PEP_ID=MMETSP0329-20121206/1249_1 /TAXON_ID=697910 /ORGANISM="Pseudo-nitzschia arenysensis, Strain B593" /LENGTH=935 /DNA_ID=CAMNT_0003610355 /DNA_START=406 /DNA_END=3213 /DNA_ORIENTATION=+